MKRFAAIIAFAGAVILSTHILAPAAPPAAKAPPTATDLAFIQQAEPLIDKVNTQVDRLRERLTAPPAYPAPTRDPFRFGAREKPSRPAAAVPALEAPMAPPVETPPVLPQLVAIAARATGARIVRTAAFMVGDDVQIFEVGDTIMKFVIRSIGPDAVELADPIAGRTFLIALQ